MRRSLLALAMVATPRRRLVQRRLVAVPIGVLIHLLLDGIWTDTQAFWWPFAGLAWSDAELPELARAAFDLVLEAAGARPRGGAGGASASTSRPAAPVRSHRPLDRDVATCRDGRPTRHDRRGRHGRTAANAGGLLLGRADPALDDEGVRQGPRCPACAALDVARSSRARWPAAGHGRGARRRGRRAADRRGRRALDRARLRRASTAGPGRRPCGDVGGVAGRRRLGAAGRGVAGRAGPAGAGRVEAIWWTRRGRTVVVVTHVSPIKAAVAWALGVGDEVAWRMCVAPASITRIGVAGPAPSLRSFNEVAHLA